MSAARRELPPYQKGVTYSVELGESFTRASDVSFFTLTYTFKPQSVDETAPGTLSIRDETVCVNLPQNNSGERTLFEGTKRQAKDCILIFDKERNTFVLERLSSNIPLSHVRDSARRVDPIAMPVSGSQLLKQRSQTKKAAHPAGASPKTSGDSQQPQARGTPSPQPTGAASVCSSGTDEGTDEARRAVKRSAEEDIVADDATKKAKDAEPVLETAMSETQLADDLAVSSSEDEAD